MVFFRAARLLCLSALVLVVCTVLGPGQAFGAPNGCDPITVLNPGFEFPKLDDGECVVVKGPGCPEDPNMFMAKSWDFDSSVASGVTNNVTGSLLSDRT